MEGVVGVSVCGFRGELGELVVAVVGGYAVEGGGGEVIDTVVDAVLGEVGACESGGASVWIDFVREGAESAWEGLFQERSCEVVSGVGVGVEGGVVMEAGDANGVFSQDLLAGERGSKVVRTSFESGSSAAKRGKMPAL